MRRAGEKVFSSVVGNDLRTLVNKKGVDDFASEKKNRREQLAETGIDA